MREGLAAIALHGRGQNAQAIRSIVLDIGMKQLEVVCPEAPDGCWYPYSFLAPLKDNEPWLSASLATVEQCFHGLVKESGYAREQIVLIGFSQGAALASEFVGRTMLGPIGGLIAWTGGRIGPLGCTWGELHQLAGMQVLMTGSDVDQFVPGDRVRDTAAHFARRKAATTCRMEGRPHAVDKTDIALAKQVLSTKHERIVWMHHEASGMR